MKTKTILTFVAIAFLSITTAFGQSKTEKFKVYGNCGMCESRIEKAAKGIEGVSSADWDKDTKMMALTFDASKTSVDKVQTAIAKIGHDTGIHKADNEVYNKLPGCCKYERAEDCTAKEKGSECM